MITPERESCEANCSANSVQVTKEETGFHKYRHSTVSASTFILPTQDGSTMSDYDGDDETHVQDQQPQRRAYIIPRGTGRRSRVVEGAAWVD